MNVMVILVTLAVLVTTIVYGTLKKYRLGPGLANSLIFIYCVFVLAASFIAIK
jgi:hypothetical protein